MTQSRDMMSIGPTYGFAVKRFTDILITIHHKPIILLLMQQMLATGCGKIKRKMVCSKFHPWPVQVVIYQYWEKGIIALVKY